MYEEDRKYPKFKVTVVKQKVQGQTCMHKVLPHKTKSDIHIYAN